VTPKASAVGNGHIRHLAKEENGGKGGLLLSIPMAKLLLTLIVVVTSASWGLFQFIRSMDQSLIAEQMTATRQLIERVDQQNGERYGLLLENQREIRTDIHHIREAVQ